MIKLNIFEIYCEYWEVSWYIIVLKFEMQMHCLIFHCNTKNIVIFLSTYFLLTVKEGVYGASISMSNFILVD